MIEGLDSVLKNAMPEVGIGIELSGIELPELRLEYSETPDNGLLQIADGILDDIILLSDKIRRFIRQNNIYGSTYWKRSGSRFKPSEENDHIKDLTLCSEKLKKVLAKKYSVDLFSDGSEELGEMLRTLWNAVDTVMAVPILIKRYVYVFPDGIAAEDDEIKKELLNRINVRYDRLDEII